MKKYDSFDHNEKMQSIHGIEEAEIIEIVDHHKIGDIQSNYPIYLQPKACWVNGDYYYFDYDGE